MIQQADGKFVVVGGEVVPPPPCEPDELCAIYNATYRSVLMRYNSDGSLDSSFNGTGSVVTDVNSTAYSVIQQADGKLVMSGISGTQPALWRYNIDGSIDTDFGNDGKLTTTITNGAPFYNMPTSAYSVIQQTDGKLVAAVGIHYCFTGLCASATDYPFICCGITTMARWIHRSVMMVSPAACLKIV
ncbi:MAG TPA: hypothetical protein PKK14_03765 [Pseudomonadales bacterium]|nr:hypothetical protein [Pseudomonadales bacterium]